MELILAEKPTAALKIALSLGNKLVRRKFHYETKVNGKQVCVAFAVGHLYRLVAARSSFPVFDLKWIPTGDAKDQEISVEEQVEPTPAQHLLDNLKLLASKADEITVATDYDIEGEVIGHNIVVHCMKRTDANRMKFSTLTSDELRNSYQTKSATLNWPMARAGEVRHKIDWYYGVNLSQALNSALDNATRSKLFSDVAERKSTYNRILSIGRVQGPTLALIAERVNAINAFQPTTYWSLKLKLLHSTKRSDTKAISRRVLALVYDGGSFDAQSDAQQIHDRIRQHVDANNGSLVLSQVDQSEHELRFPLMLPFDLTSLQIEAHKHFGIGPSTTLAIAQRLYLASLISYPRTSSQKLPLKLNHFGIVEKLSKQVVYSEFASSLLSNANGKLLPREGGKSDAAHPAIHPTGQVPPGKGFRDEKEQQIYDLIVRRYLACLTPNPTVQQLRLQFTIPCEAQPPDGQLLSLSYTEKCISERGWSAIYEPYFAAQEFNKSVFLSSSDTNREVLQPGLRFKVKDLGLEQNSTKPPAYFSSASLVGELEQRKLGTKSTRSNIIDTLFKRGYLWYRPLRLSPLGTRIFDILSRVCPEILSEALTRDLENKLDAIQSGELQPESVLQEAAQRVSKLYDQLRAQRDAIISAVAQQQVSMAINVRETSKKVPSSPRTTVRSSKSKAVNNNK